MSATEFWQVHQVGGPYFTWHESEVALENRRKLYPKLEELMPTHLPAKNILDFGCGPGHDTIQFLSNGAAHVWFADVSWQALETTSDRLKLHHLADQATALFADDTLPEVDYVHCAGVLHHMYDPMEALRRMRTCAPEGRAMVYDGKMSTHTDSLVPITEWWTPREFIKMCVEAGWQAVYKGSYECSAEWRPDCYAACFSLS